MKKTTLILFGLIFLISCKEKNAAIESEIKIEEINESELMVQKILNLPDIQWIYHPELPERTPVKILESELIDKKFDLNKFGKEVRIISPDELKKEGIKDYLEFHKLEFKNDTLEFGLSYDIEGAGSAGKFIKENGKWKILEYEVWEF